MNRDELETVIIGYTKERRSDIANALDEYTREVKAAAWDEGFEAGWAGQDPGDVATNPYVKGSTDDDA